MNKLTPLLTKINQKLNSIRGAMVPDSLLAWLGKLWGKIARFPPQTIAHLWHQVRNKKSPAPQANVAPSRQKTNSGHWPKPRQLLPGAILITVAILAGHQAHEQVQKMLIKLASPIRKPTSLPPLTRASYWGDHRKHVHLPSVHIPLAPNHSPPMTSMQMDFMLKTSNRYLKLYIERNEHIVRNQIISAISPTPPQFILTREGRKIIKLKIQDEINQMLKKIGPQGHIEQVNISNIIAG